MPPFFTVDELVRRWGVSADVIGAYGAAGRLQFGVFVTGLLHVEIGDYGPAPDYEFRIEASGSWSGFVPISSKTVAAAWQSGSVERIDIPNTDCGKVVRVVSLIPYDMQETEMMLLVDAEELARFERAERAPVSDEPLNVVDIGNRVKLRATEIAAEMEHGKRVSQSAVAKKLASEASSKKKEGNKDPLYVGQKGAHSESWYKNHLKGWQPEK